MSNAIGLAQGLRFGVQAATLDGVAARRTIELVAVSGYDAAWFGDHIAIAGAINDPMLQIAYCAGLYPNLMYGTGVYLLPLRNPVVVAKMVATLDRLLGGGHFILGVGVGGEFPREYQASGVPLGERGGRANEALALIRRLWTESDVAHRGKYLNFEAITQEPRPLTPNGPPIWVGGRSEAALKRAARLGDGWMPYVVTPQRYAEGLEFIAAEASRAGRTLDGFATALHIFCNLGSSFEAALDEAASTLSRRYSMDFRKPAERYAALGRPADVAAQLERFVKAGVREFIIDPAAPDRDGQIERFGREVIPLMGRRPN